MSRNHTVECTLELCPISESSYEYRPSLAMNTTLLALFGLSCILNIGQGLRYKTWTYMASMVLGNSAEVIGYVGRVMSYDNPFELDPFLIQICCLTIAPAFLAAGIYLSLARLVTIYGADISRIKPQRYTQFFVACDFVSLVLQGAGGGIASVSSQNHEDPAMGTNVMLAGLASQVLTLSVFMILCAEYAWRVRTSGRKLDPMHAHLRNSRRFKGFMVALAVATLCIMTRSIYRLVELSQGWNGELITNETYFFVLEGVMVSTAVLTMNVFHPGYCLREAYHINARSKEKDTKSIDTDTTTVERGGIFSRR